jgi:hypothetical protein
MLFTTTGFETANNNMTAERISIGTPPENERCLATLKMAHE